MTVSFRLFKIGNPGSCPSLGAERVVPTLLSNPSFSSPSSTAPGAQVSARCLFFLPVFARALPRASPGLIALDGIPGEGRRTLGFLSRNLSGPEVRGRRESPLPPPPTCLVCTSLGGRGSHVGTDWGE
ncbi:uncharacterized protein [Symphalangus syndactylus]|uniref:uncharacterized protein n=1 Tax=Symphalangus syndactylus TaxID=9590 RepID=UPI002440EE0C|nr:uncharacterized protein LOC129458243 [Symphalangus syndactylus]